MDSNEVEPVVAISSEDLSKKLTCFLKGSSYDKSNTSPEVINAGLFLLKNLPSARSAVLDHLCNVFDDSVNAYLIKQDADSNVAEPSVLEPDETLVEIHDVLTNLIHSHPEVWAPVISAWSIELLGHISSKYIGRRNTPHSSNLNEVLQLWMTCQPTKTLIEISSECFASMVDNTPDVSVDALLDASAKHSTHFDWVVAHIGSCFPKTVITRVLSSSFKDFKESSPDSWIGQNDRNSKMNSAVGILGHLAGQHEKAIKEALIALFNDGLKLSPLQGEEVKGKQGKVELRVAPFLLCLAEKSPMLLTTLVSELTHVLTPKVLNKLADSFTRDKGKIVPNTDTLLGLTVHLITLNHDCILKVLKFLIETAAPSDDDLDAMDTDIALSPEVQQTCGILMNRLITDLQRVVNARCTDTALEISFLHALKPHTVYICKTMLNSPESASKWYSQILACLALYTDESTATEILTSVALYATTGDQLSIFVQIMRAIESKYLDIIDSFLQMAIGMLESVKKEDCVKFQLLKNVSLLITWENEETKYHFKIKEKARIHIEAFGENLDAADSEVAFVVMELLNNIGFPQNFSTASHIKLCSLSVHCLFQVMLIENLPERVKTSDTCLSYLRKLCGVSPAAQAAILKHLLSDSISSNYCKLFGGKMEDVSSTSSNAKLDQIDPKLLRENRKPRLGNKPGIFHAGVIGTGLKLPPKFSTLKQEEKQNNKLLLLKALSLACGDFHGKQLAVSEVLQIEEVADDGSAVLTLGVVSAVCSHLVDIVTPDVMYNKMDWPDDEFLKVTIERDLQVKRRFEDNPVLWEIMGYLATGDGAMWVCAPILRGILGTLMSHWEGSRDKSTRNSPWHLNASCSVIGWMRQGGLLAPPLAYTGEILHLLTPYEAYLILLNIWRYMHQEKPPSATSIRAKRKTQACDLAYMLEILPILHKNIDKLGHKFARFYVPEHAEKYQKLVSNTFSSITVE